MLTRGATVCWWRAQPWEPYLLGSNPTSAPCQLEGPEQLLSLLYALSSKSPPRRPTIVTTSHVSVRRKWRVKVVMDNDWHVLSKCSTHVCSFCYRGNSSFRKNHFPRGYLPNSLLISTLSHLTFSQINYYLLERITEKSCCFLNSNELQKFIIN